MVYRVTSPSSPDDPLLATGSGIEGKRTVCVSSVFVVSKFPLRFNYILFINVTMWSLLNTPLLEYGSQILGQFVPFCAT